ncbi:MAG: methyltransferase domain-containing protein [Sedimentisphaerales bacterium]|nr:methyltransferase domain-containing protein [Sedimentisphaerales bacterium]
MIQQMTDNPDIFICPACGGSIKTAGNKIECLQCHNQYQIEDGIPLLFESNESDGSERNVTALIKSFYEETPFPNYENLENVGDLIQKAKRGVFARLLNDQIPFNIRILEVGCGTGQMSNFFGASQRYVFGTDICLNSLKLAQQFKKRNNLQRVGFYQMNLFRPIFRDESFSLVICNGVLHHTSDPFAGFQSIARFVKKGGHILIGLYNKYGRCSNDLRRFLFKISNNRFKFLDSRLRDKTINDIRKLTWFRDQYKNPHESKHTFGEVLRWFEETGFTFVSSIPRTKAFETFSENEKLFNPASCGSRFDLFITQARLLLALNNEGGFFIMIGRKKF